MNREPCCFYYRVQVQKFYRKDLRNYCKQFCYYPYILFLEAIGLTEIMGPVTENQGGSKSKEAIKILVSFVIIFIYFTIVITFYQQYEGWNLTDTMFFILATLATVGKSFSFHSLIYSLSFFSPSRIWSTTPN